MQITQVFLIVRRKETAGFRLSAHSSQVSALSLRGNSVFQLRPRAESGEQRADKPDLTLNYSGRCAPPNKIASNAGE